MKTPGCELENRAGEKRRREGRDKLGTRYDSAPLLGLQTACVFQHLRTSQHIRKPTQTMKTILPHSGPTHIPKHHATNTPEHQEDLIPSLEVVWCTFCVPGPVLGMETLGGGGGVGWGAALPGPSGNSCPAGQSDMQTVGFSLCRKGCA